MWRSLLLLALSGCAIGPGEPMGTLSPRIEAAYVTAADRDVGEGFQRLASDYEIRVDHFVLGAADLLLMGGGNQASTAAFDPANPPPGYSNCHGGHCHADDGSLPSYEEVAARTGGGAAASTAVAIHAGEFDLVAGVELASPACEPDCSLGEPVIQSGALPVSQLVIEGVVRDGRAEPRISERPFSLLLPLSGADSVVTISAPLELPVDRESEPLIALTARVAPGAAIFDGVDWETAETTLDGRVALEAVANSEQAASVLEALRSGAMSFEVSRRAP